MTRIIPKIIARPTEINASVAIAYITWMKTTVAKSTVGSTNSFDSGATLLRRDYSLVGSNCWLVFGFFTRLQTLSGFVGFT